MRFFHSFLSLLVAATASAQSNPFNNPMAGIYELRPGSTYTLSWSPTTPGSVTLQLRYGNPGALEKGTLIVSDLPNSGTYAWHIPAGTPQRTDYTVEISSDQDPTDVNYSDRIIIESTAPEGTSTSALGSTPVPTATSTGPTPTMTMSMSMTMKMTTTMTATPTMTTTTTVPTSTNVAYAIGAGRFSGAVAGLVAVGVGAVANL